MTANFLGREKNYKDVTGFDESATSIAAAFAPASTYGGRIERLFEEIASMGFKGVDLWDAHCHSAWATTQHFKAVRAASEKCGLKIVSIAGGARNLTEFEMYCQLAHEVGAPMLGLGGDLLPDYRGQVLDLLERYKVKFGFENHPNEKTPADVIEKIGHGNYPRLGATLDTGWFATHGYPILDAIDELKEHLMLVHLKNIEAPGAHEAAAWDRGCLDMEPIVRKLKEVGYAGYMSVEYEPLDHDPSESCAEFRKKIEEWIASPEVVANS